MKTVAILLVSTLAVLAGAGHARARTRSSPESYDSGRNARRPQSREVMAGLRPDRVAAPAQVVALQSPDQRKIAEELFDEERRKAEANRPRRRCGGPGRDRRGGP